MTRILYFDCFAGISGTMMLGALLDLGIDKDVFLSEFKKLELGEYSVDIKKSVNHGIKGTCVCVEIKKEEGSLKNIRDIFDIIEKSSVTETVKALSKQAFKEIISAEANISEVGIESVRFTDIKARTYILKIVGIAICLHLLGIEKVFSSMPLESRTPIGMGFIKTVCQGFGNMPAMTIDRIGYGHGKEEIGKPNSLRVVMGSLFEEDWAEEEIALLEIEAEDISVERDKVIF